MNRTTAAAILGVEPEARSDEIERAYARELEFRRAAGDNRQPVDEAREILIAALPPTKPERGGDGIKPPIPRKRPIMLALCVFLLAPSMLLVAAGNALGVDNVALVLALALASLTLAPFYDRALRAAFGRAAPLGGFGLGIAALIIISNLANDKLTGIVPAAIACLMAIGSAITIFTARTQSQPAP